MKDEKLQQVKEIIQEREKNYDFSDFILNFIDEDDLKECNSTQEVRDLIEKANDDNDITNTEIIYSGAAIEYLQENDPSLTYSLEIADEFGYSPKDLNSEILASILATRENEEDFGNFLDELEKDLDVVFTD